MRLLRVIRLIPPLLCVTLSACGYTFQQAKNPLLEKEGVSRVFVKPLINNTYKPGVENTVYNQLLRTITANGRVKLVTKEDDADAVLEGFVDAAYYVASARTTADRLFPLGAGQSNREVASEFAATLGCKFALNSKKKDRKNGTQIWTSGFARSKTFPASNQLGIYGTTSALINESEFDRALRDLAESMASDLHESMLAMF